VVKKGRRCTPGLRDKTRAESQIAVRSYARRVRASDGPTHPTRMIAPSLAGANPGLIASGRAAQPSNRASMAGHPVAPALLPARQGASKAKSHGARPRRQAQLRDGN